MPEDEYEKSELPLEEARKRLAAAEFDVNKIVDHIKVGYHPNLNET